MIETCKNMYPIRRYKVAPWNLEIAIVLASVLLTLFPTAISQTHFSSVTMAANPVNNASSIITAPEDQTTPAVTSRNAKTAEFPVVQGHTRNSVQCPPGTEFTYVPPFGSFENLEGRVACIDPSAYQVAVYIYVSGWWTKPTFAQPLTPIRPDGTWVTDITTGGIDQNATRIVAYLAPSGYAPPLMSGGQTLPDELEQNTVASAIVERDPIYRTLQFSGYTWQVKASESVVGPGPNFFSDREEDVWVDPQGRLHLRIVFRDNKWYTTEITNTESLGYGTYTFKLTSSVDQLDPNVILGLFTWDDNAPEYNYREIDIELSRWGETENDNAQYVVQPWNNPGNMHRFNLELLNNNSTYSFDWRADSIKFSSSQGHASTTEPGNEIDSWLYTGPDIPPTGKENAHINLWLLNGRPPIDEQELEVIVEMFAFTPIQGNFGIYLPIILKH